MITFKYNKLSAGAFSLLIPLTFLLFVSCEKDLPVYDYPDNELNFDLKLNSTTGIAEEFSYSFVFAGENVEKDTAWFTVNTQGFLADYDRPFELKQVPAGEGLKDAVAGQHYVSFDSEEMRKFLVIPANSNTVKIPVLVLKDASLEQEDVHLFFEIKENEHFKQGLPVYRTAKLSISNRLSKPTSWGRAHDYYFDPYGPVKHRFMIEVTGLTWDDEFCQKIQDDNDFGYIQYLTTKLYKALEAENAARAARGEDILREADGSPVTFTFGSYYA